MVLHGKAAPTPTRAGLLAVLACALPVLAFGPVRAEPPARPVEKPQPLKSVPDGNTVLTDVLGLHVIDADTEAINDVLIAVDNPSDEVKKVREEVEALSKKLEARRKELKELEGKQGATVGAPKAERIEVGDLRVDAATREVAKAGHPVRLTATEFDLLWFLASHPRRVFSRQQLMESVWGYQASFDTGTVTVHIRRLREKIETDPSQPRHLETVWGVGYRFKP